MASKKLKIFNLLILLISTLLSLYLCEGYLTFLNNRDSLENKIKIYKKQTGKDYDIRSILSVYDDERKKNNDVAIRYLPRVLLNDNFEDSF